MTIQEILNHPSFKGVVEKMQEDLTRKVMGKNTTDDERDLALLKYHMIEDLLVEMAATKDTDNGN